MEPRAESRGEGDPVGPEIALKIAEGKEIKGLQSLQDTQTQRAMSYFQATCRHHYHHSERQ